MEVPYVGSDAVRWTQVKVPLLCEVSSENQCCLPPQDLAGSACFGPPSFGRVVWRIHQSSSSILELVELDENEAQMSGLRLLFHEPLSPFIAVYPDQVNSNEATLCLWVITTSGVVCLSKIRRFYKYRNCLSLAKADIAQFSLANEHARLDQVTAFAALGGSACVGGKSGTILCFTLEQLDGEVKDLCYELKENDARLGRLWGFVGRAKSAGPLQSLHVQLMDERLMLFALHEDGTFRVWDVSDRCRLLNYSVYKPDLQGFTPEQMWVQEYDQRSGSQNVAFLYTHTEETIADNVNIYDIQYSRVDRGANRASITFVQKVSSIQGRVVDLKLLTEKLWWLEDADGGYLLKCGNLNREGPPDVCQLFEAELENQLFHQPEDDWEDLILFRQSTNVSMKVELQFPASEMFLPRVLQPGIYQHHVLRKVLEKHKRRVLESDFLVLTKDGVRKEILAAVEGESLNGNTMEHLLEWKNFLGDYVSLWKESNVPYGLFYDTYSGSIGLIRRQSLSVMRHFSNFEKLYHDGGGRGTVLAVDNINPEASDAFDLLLACTQTVSRQLGRLPVSTFGEAVLAKKRVLLPHVSSAYLHVLKVGYDPTVLTSGISHLGIDMARRKKLGYRQRQRKFELQMMLYVQQFRETVGGWEGVFDIVEKYTNHLVEDMRITISGRSVEGLAHGIVSKKLVAKTAAQISWTYYEAARDLLLFLGYIVSLKGQVGLSSDNVLKVQMRLIGQVQKALLVSLLVRWLSTSYIELVPLEDFSLHLSSLRLDGASGESPQNRHDRYEEMTLAELLMLPWSQGLGKGSFLRMKGITTSEALLYNSKAFVSWIVWGENRDRQPFPSSHSISLATVLLQHGQFVALQDFLHFEESIHNKVEVAEDLLNSPGDWCARLHLVGCSLLGQHRTSIKDPSNNKVEKAVRCFFRVASAVGQDRKELEKLLQITGMQTNFSAHCSAAAWKLQYYEWIMQMFEQNSVSEGACHFAHAALQEVEEAVKSLDSDDVETSNTASLMKGRLWANIFKFSLDLNLYQEAYCAIISNPEKESKFICLRRFLIVLCEHKATEILCGPELPYAGLLERVEQELVLKADYSDVSANPNPFKLLYSFHVQRSNFRRAALFIYMYYLRMKEMARVKDQLPVTFILEEQLHALAAAINALHLVDPSYAWLDVDVEVSGSQSYRASTSKRLRVYADSSSQYVPGCSSVLIDLDKLQKEYILTLAELLLVQKNVKLNFDGQLLPADLLAMLVQSGLYEMAFNVLFGFWKDSALRSELERIFRIMTEKWCTHEHEIGVERPSTRDLLESGKKLLLLSSSIMPEDADQTFGSSTELNKSKDIINVESYTTLQKYLDKYSKLHSRLPAVVAETMLSIDRLIELPVWLVDMLKGGRHGGFNGMSGHRADPPALLRIYLDFGRISEATLLLLEFLNAWASQRPVDILQRKKMSAVWFPYALVDRLTNQLAQSSNSEQLTSLQSSLGSAVLKHLQQVEIDSKDVKSLV